jgi:hypothetical protein
MHVMMSRAHHELSKTTPSRLPLTLHTAKSGKNTTRATDAVGSHSFEMN